MKPLNKQTKAELITYITELEARTVEARLRQVRQEIVWIAEDLVSLVRSVYEAGAHTRRLLWF